MLLFLLLVIFVGLVGVLILSKQGNPLATPLAVVLFLAGSGLGIYRLMHTAESPQAKAADRFEALLGQKLAQVACEDVADPHVVLVVQSEDRGGSRGTAAREGAMAALKKAGKTVQVMTPEELGFAGGHVTDPSRLLTSAATKNPDAIVCLVPLLDTMTPLGKLPPIYCAFFGPDQSWIAELEAGRLAAVAVYADVTDWSARPTGKDAFGQRYRLLRPADAVAWRNSNR